MTRSPRPLCTLTLMLMTSLWGAVWPAQAAPLKNGFDLAGSLVPTSEIHQGGPPRDGIPALDDPRFVAAGEAGFLEDTDRVLGLVLGGEARAYPIGILNWHEIVNDQVAGRPVAVTFCPLCGTGVAFDARIGGDRALFGVSGLLYNSDVLLYDRRTQSLWSQIKRQAVSGPLKGQRLRALPVDHTTWRAWRAEHPKTLVLSTHTGHKRDYRKDPYAGYESEAGLYFPISARSKRYHPKERVLGLELAGRFKAYPFAELARTGEREIRDRVKDHEVLIRFDAENGSARAFDAEGRPLAGINGFWFAWYAFHPDTEVFEARKAGR
jgi:hypothetical protein